MLESGVKIGSVGKPETKVFFLFGPINFDCVDAVTTKISSRSAWLVGLLGFFFHPYRNGCNFSANQKELHILSNWIQLHYLWLKWVMLLTAIHRNFNRLGEISELHLSLVLTVLWLIRGIKQHKCQVSGFWGESPDFAPRLPPCAVSSRGGGRRNLRIFDRVSGFLRIYVLFHLKVTKLYVFIAVMACPSQLIRTNLLKITTEDNFGNFHKQ